MKIKVDKNDLKEYNENFDNEKMFKILDDANEVSLDDYFCDSNLKVSENVILTRFKNLNDYEISLNFNLDDMLLLSLVTELDNRCYDCKNFLWNNLILDDDDIKEINTTSVETESLENLFYDVENQLQNQIFTTDDLKKNPRLWIDFSFLDDFKFKNLIDIEGLKEEIEYGLIEMFEIFKSQINYYLHSDDFDEFLYWNNYYNLEYITDEINKNGFYETYVS